MASSSEKPEGSSSDQPKHEPEEELEGAVGVSEAESSSRFTIPLKSTTDDDDDDEDEDPLELKNQENLPPTPYEECLDLKIFETLAQQELEAESQRAEDRKKDVASMNFIGKFVVTVLLPYFVIDESLF